NSTTGYHLRWPKKNSTHCPGWVDHYSINAEDFPNWRDVKSERAMREARRLFYVGVTRPRKELFLVFKEGNHSPWVAELYQRSQQV
ncbi:hypothetical protein N1E03_28300, partial [Pseudomonas aeruginosa]|nr:hypothetical protein [Pseudomonas aeruginosa]MCS8396350.1 hypothetical protein [Pseudomonas aeruginosa]MCS8770234.1 hypothetical protein [Pseudomonas aeruginosa]MCS9735599.1 hypothetical protein [Pseudomonas aeruginosa]MCT0280045.1 hypothetical protein [Pseudomonas aeruginosa]